MKILFVCMGNTARSQMAEAFYRKLTHSSDADSAGTQVEKSGRTLQALKQERPDRYYVVEAMRQVGLDVSKAVSTQLTQDMPAKYDLVVNMADKDDSPQLFKGARRYIHWDVADPLGISLEVTATARDVVKQKVEDLVKTL